VYIARPQFRRQAGAFPIEQQQRVIAGGLIVPVVGAVLLLALHWNLGAVHVQHYPLWRIDGLGLGDEFAIAAGQATEVVLLGQHLGLKSLQAGGQRRTPIPSLLGTDQPERRILREPLDIVDILIARDAAVDGLEQQVRQRKLRVLPAS